MSVFRNTSQMEVVTKVKADFGQSNFGQSIFGQSIFLCHGGAQRVVPQPRKNWAPKGGGPKFRAFFFHLPPPFSSFCPMYTFGVLGLIQERCWFSQIDFFVSTSDQDFVSFQPILCHPHTQITIILFHDVQRDIPNLEFSPIHVSIGFSQIAFPIIVLPKDGRTDSAQEERPDLPYWTMI